MKKVQTLSPHVVSNYRHEVLPDCPEKDSSALPDAPPPVLWPTDTQSEAARLYSLGFSIGPTKPSSKEPYLWRKLCYCRIDPVAIPMLFEHRAGILVITGSISRNLTILDCDDMAAGMHQIGQPDGIC